MECGSCGKDHPSSEECKQAQTVEKALGGYRHIEMLLEVFLDQRPQDAMGYENIEPRIESSRENPDKKQLLLRNLQIGFVFGEDGRLEGIYERVNGKAKREWYTVDLLPEVTTDDGSGTSESSGDSAERV